MIRRIHVAKLEPGTLPLDERQAHHARNVLRLEDGEAVEVFDDAGQTASAELLHDGSLGAAVRVGAIHDRALPGFAWRVASAVPKGDRADWMVEKLSELGAEAFIPLIAARSVVLPEGKGKRERWTRIATESAKQCRRPGVMRIGPLTPLADAIRGAGAAGWFLSTEGGALPVLQAVQSVSTRSPLTLLVGPEGGWTAGEIGQMSAVGLIAIRLTATVLRTETAAIAAAAVLGSLALPVPAGDVEGQSK